MARIVPAKDQNPDYQALYFELKEHCNQMFHRADKEGLYLGLGRNAALPDTRQSQEGNMVKKLRRLVK